MLGFFHSNHSETPYIKLDRSKCHACWECIPVCSNAVIGKVDFLGHRHALIDKEDKCTGCAKCVKTCKFNAYIKKEIQHGSQRNKDVQ